MTPRGPADAPLLRAVSQRIDTPLKNGNRVNKTVLAVILAAASLVAACGSDDSNSSSSSSGTSGTAETPNGVTVKSNQFVPASLTVKVGDTVTWTWAGGTHDVVSGANCASDGAWSSTLQSTSGSKFTHTFDTAGSFEYFCTPHCVSSAMKGTIVVQ
jgi:plastocyanin